MIFVIQATERLENDEYDIEYYKLIKNMISQKKHTQSHRSTIVRVFFLSQQETMERDNKKEGLCGF